MTTSRIRESFHLEQSNLVEAARKYINDVAVMGGPFSKVIIKLHMSALEIFRVI